MKKITLVLAAFCTLVLHGGVVLAQSAASALKDKAEWHGIMKEQAPSSSLMRSHPRAYQTFLMDEVAMKEKLFHLSSDPNQAGIFSIPMGDGTYREFRVWEASMMPDELAARYPDIKTFNAVAVDDQRVTAKLDFTLFGFHAMIFGQNGVSFVDPYDNLRDGYYFSHFQRDETKAFSERMQCMVKGNDEVVPNGLSPERISDKLPNLDNSGLHHNANRTLNGWTSRTYRLALSADTFYCHAATGVTNPTKAQAFSCMTTSMNRINGVYNREFSVQMNFVTHEDTLIYGCSGHTNGTDPFLTIDNNPNSCLTTNQSTITTRIGSANYDVGHVFTTGGGGLSMLGVVCNNSLKAESVTGSSTPTGDGYDIDYVAHEMGHEFGSNHTFNNNMDGSCSGNAVNTCAYEPASGGTIMDYAGICNPDDIQMHSDAYFSASSLVQITNQLVSTETACAVTAATGNHAPTLTTFSATYTIPYKTPFELAGPTAVDSVADTANTYQWLQWNLGDFGKRLNQTYRWGPIFRSYNPVYTPTRIFPKLSMVLSGVLSNAGTEGAEGEKAPDTARFMTFKMVARAIMNGYGCFLFPDDTIHVIAWQTGTAGAYQGFKVTSQNTAVTYASGSSQTVTWNVVGTNAAPVSAANVDIYMSTDGGTTWAYTIGNFPNNGSATVTIPSVGAASSTCRIKVKGTGNIFFNINSANFTVNPPTGVSPITGTLTVCQGSTVTLADATPGGTWSSSATGTATVSSGGVVTGVAGGTATISYVAAGGTATAIVTVNPLPNAGTITGGGVTMCIGTTLTLADAATGGTWSSTVIGVASVSATGVVTAATGGTTTISYTLTNSCGTVAATTTITVNPGAGITTAPVVSGPATPCSGTTATYTATLAGATTFNWTVTGTGWSGTSTTGTLVATVGTGVGQIIVSGSNTCGAGPNDTINVTPISLPGVPTVSLVGTLPCTGATAATYTATSTGATSYIWSVTGTGWSGSSTTGTINVTLGTGTGTIICTGMNACGTSRADTTLATSSPMPTTPAITLVGGSPCVGSATADYSATSGGATSYNWTVLGTGWSGSSTTGTITVTIGTGTGMVICSGVNTCGSGIADTMLVTPSGAPAAATAIDATTGICTGSTGTFITSAITGATSYLWTITGTGWSGTSTSTILNVTVGTGPATITVSGVGPCGTGASYTLAGVTPVAIPVASFTLASHIENTGVNDLLTYTGTTSTSGLYTWNFAGGTASPGIGVGPHLVSWATPGLKTITLSVTDTGCTSIVFSDTVLVTIPTEVGSIGGANDGVLLVPNPSNGIFDVAFEGNEQSDVTIRMNDVQGRVVFENRYDSASGGNIKIDVSWLPSSVYTITIITNGKVTNKKLVIAH